MGRTIPVASATVVLVARVAGPQPVQIEQHDSNAALSGRSDKRTISGVHPTKREQPVDIIELVDCACLPEFHQLIATCLAGEGAAAGVVCSTAAAVRRPATAAPRPAGLTGDGAAAPGAEPGRRDGSRPRDTGCMPSVTPPPAILSRLPARRCGLGIAPVLPALRCGLGIAPVLPAFCRLDAVGLMAPRTAGDAGGSPSLLNPALADAALPSLPPLPGGGFSGLPGRWLAAAVCVAAVCVPESVLRKDGRGGLAGDTDRDAGRGGSRDPGCAFAGEPERDDGREPCRLNAGTGEFAACAAAAAARSEAALPLLDVAKPGACRASTRAALRAALRARICLPSSSLGLADCRSTKHKPIC